MSRACANGVDQSANVLKERISHETEFGLGWVGARWVGLVWVEVGWVEVD